MLSFFAASLLHFEGIYMALYGNKNITGKERILAPDDLIVSKTDLSGKLTYVNRTFMKISGLNEQDCLGVQHNLIRHPEMPRCVFQLLWDTLKSKQEIFAYVNNRAVNGDNYWVFAHVTPSVNQNGDVTGYHSNRRAPNRDTLNTHIVPLYKELLKIEQGNSSPKQGMEESYQKIKDLLEESNMTFNQLMFSMGV